MCTKYSLPFYQLHIIFYFLEAYRMKTESISSEIILSEAIELKKESSQ